MIFSLKTCTCILLAAMLCVFLFAPVFAAEKEPDPKNNPVLASIIQMGSKLYYLGNRTGLEGWLIVKDGQVQIAYAMPNSKYAIIGGLFGPDGENVSADQVQTLLTTNKELNNELTTSAAQSPPGAGTPAAALVGAQPTGASAAASTAAPALLPPGERLMKDLQNAAGVTIGDASAPLLLMVMDPNCPHCQATWKLLHDSVMNKKLQIRLVPIGAQGTDHERAAAVLLHVADPLTAWDKYVGGDKAQLAGTPDPSLVAAVHANFALIDSWHINMTPYLVYRAKDGKVKIVQGELEQVSSVLNDIQ